MSARAVSRTRQLVAALIACGLVAALLSPSEGEARPGGGSSFRSGSSSSGSRSGSSSSSSSSSSGGFRSGSSTSSSSSGGFRSGSSTSTSSTSSGGGVYLSSSSSSSGSGYTSPSSVGVLERASRGKDAKDAALWTAGKSPFEPGRPRPSAWPTDKAVSPYTLNAFMLVIAAFGLAIVAFIIAVFVKIVRGAVSMGKGWSTKSTSHEPPHPAPIESRNELEAFRHVDPGFSIALFEDFLYALYTEVRVAQGAGKLDRVSPFLASPVRAELAAEGSPPIGQVVVGALRFVGCSTRTTDLLVEIELETNYAEMRPGPGGAPVEKAFWSREHWVLSRSRNARSRAPDRARVLDCPGCGAPLDRIVGGQCQHCKRVVDTGAFDWVVTSIDVDEKEERGPMLTGTTEEVGTDFPTVIDPRLAERHRALLAKDPAFDMRAFEARIGLVFGTMQHGWSSLEWHRARPFLSDNLWQAQRYWIEAYRSSGLRNVTERARITRIDLARVTDDAWFDAITVRVHATGLDYTIRDADRAVVGGSREKERQYTEYWTFLRGRNATGKPHVAAECPRCGAPLQVSMAVECGACKAKVNSPAFDWVLARIEQDDVYTG